MRNKIIAVNAVIVAIIGLLSYVIVRQSLETAAGSTAQLKQLATRDVESAAARLQLSALQMERWISAKAAEPGAQEVLSKGTASARGDAATAFCDGVANQAKGVFEGVAPSLIALVDTSGKIVGRNGSTLSRGDDVGASYPAFKDAIAKARSGSDVWADPARGDAYLASYAPVRDEAGKPAGALVIGMPVNDGISRVAASTARGVVLAIQTAKGETKIAANSTNAKDEADEIEKNGGIATITASLKEGHARSGEAGSLLFAVSPLEGFGDGKKAALACAAPASIIEGGASIPTSILGMTVLGLILVCIGGWLLGNYISEPIGMLEEGLLAIINGQQDKRFQLEHAELGGLSFRIDQLLNQLMGIEEDTTDEQGRVSAPPKASNFQDAMSVDNKGGAPTAEAAGLDAAALQKLAAEPADKYYARLYKEYIAAKKALGEATDHITEDAFNTRIQGMELEASRKHGKPVRYHVQAKAKEVVLLAVPLS